MNLQLFARKKEKEMEEQRTSVPESVEKSTPQTELDGSAGEPNTQEEMQQYEKEKLTNLTEDDVRKAVETLKKYKEGKDRFDRKIRANEEWWKLRHWQIIESEEEKKKKGMTEPVSAWLHNSINNKHADMMDNFPEPTVMAIWNVTTNL